MMYYSSMMTKSLTILIASAAVAMSAPKEVTFSRTELSGIGPEQNVMRRDPSDIIKVDDLYYVWYSKGKISTGYDATVWFATSTDGIAWEEQGQALAKGATGSWEGASVFTPNILVAEGKYYLFYTGTSKPYKKPFSPDSKIGVAVADNPAGPWVRSDANPIIRNSENAEDFDSHLIDDACLLTRDGKYWLYYKGRQLGKTPHETQMGVAVAEHPSGPYIKHEANPVIAGNHEVVVWPKGAGVEALIGTTGPKSITNSVMYSADGIHFEKVRETGKGAWAGGTYRPDAFTDNQDASRPEWGVEISKAKLPCLGRFDINWAE